MPHVRWIIPPLALATFALAGCSDQGAGHDAHGDNSEVVEDAREIEVTADAFSFDPDPIEIGAGEDVTIVLTSVDLEHDFVVEAVDFHVHADPGETEVGGLRIDVPGTYSVHCSVPGHRESGMEATITVTG